MKSFHCQCGNRIFFDNTTCLACGRPLGFDPRQLAMLSLGEAGEGRLLSPDGAAWVRCGNQRLHGHCNWLLPAGTPESLCQSCRLNRVIPALDHTDNLQLWSKVEQAKRRLIYSLRSLDLPLEDRQGTRLGFRIMEDRRRNPDVFESFVATAHHDGIITINIAEADDVTRHAVREQMRERYRTLLGHLRHESGHFYFSRLTTGPGVLEECRERFGDERSDYPSALQHYYDHGAAPDWPERHVSAYASAHPAEDFAETFAHFLHINDALESARAAGLADSSEDGGRGWIKEWMNLSVTLNEILRSLGGDDPYPFVLTNPVVSKLEFMDRIVRRPVAPQGG